MLTLAVMLAYAIMEALEWVRGEMLHEAGHELDRHISPRLFDLTFEARRRQMPGGTLQPLNDWRTVREFLHAPFLSALMEVPVAVVFLVLVYLISPWLGWLTLASAVLQVLVAALTEREERLDILVNNAGAAWGAHFDVFPENGWDRTVDLNMKTPFFLTQQLHPLLRAAGQAGPVAKVIMIASVDGQKINPWETYAYQASKAGLIHLTRRMAARLVRENIVVNAIAPGFFPSQMNRLAANPPASVLAAIPVRRMGMAEDIAAAAIYLASRAGNYVVGTTLTVDGGLVNADCAEDFPDAGG